MKAGTAKAGSLLFLDEGEYSDYRAVGFFVVLQDFSPSEELEIVGAERYKDTEIFVAHLIKKGLLLEIEYSNLYLGAYGLDTADFTPFKE
jgi:hypothetical protein